MGRSKNSIGDSVVGLVIFLFAVPIFISPFFAIEAIWRLISRHSQTLISILIAFVVFIAGTYFGVFAPLVSHGGKEPHFLAFTFEVIFLAIAYFTLAIVTRVLGRESSKMLGLSTGLFSAAFVFPVVLVAFGSELLLRFGISLHS